MTSPEVLDGTQSRAVEATFRKFFSKPPGRLTPEEQRLGLPAMRLNVNTSQARHVWLPLRFDGDRPFIDWRPEWSLDEFG